MTLDPQTEVDLQDARLTDEDLEDVQRLLYVRSLALGPGFSDEGVRMCVEAFPELEQVNLISAARISPEAVALLSNLKKLKSVRLPERLMPAGTSVLRELGFVLMPDRSLQKP